ncbi:hypothetical protein KY311_02315 [Candidatus Woesearchaeota archaeon]|nr:hypothetical protein [Candidatus Woesearchaeota archaeon]
MVVSCAQDGTQRGLFGIGGKEEKAEGTYVGTKGIEISLEDPSSIRVTPGDSFAFDVRVENLGWSNANVELYLSGYDPSFLKYNRNKASVSLNGKSGVGDSIVPGDWDILRFESSSISSPGQLFPQNTVITACYQYETQLTYSTCIDGDADQKCELSVSNPSLGAGQGAPVGVDSVTSSATRKAGGKVRQSYTISFSQKDSDNQARIIAKDKVSDACAGKALDQYRDFDIISIDDVRLGNLRLECLPKGTLNLAHQNTITCFADISSTSDYTSALVVKASYGVKKQITKPITIVTTY